MLDWIGRTLLLILAGLSTFAVIASLMAASVVDTGSAPRDASGAGVAQRGSQPDTDSVQPPRSAEPGESSKSSAQGDGELVRVPAPPERPDPLAHWLEALTWAVLALAGFAAAALLVLLRITFHLATIARQRS